MTTYLKMANSLIFNDASQKNFWMVKSKNHFSWKDEDSGLIVKARPDVLHDNMIVDLKTIRDASVHSYQRDMVDGWYHVQGAMIRDAVRIS